jgi:hypothetical protein
LALARVGLSSAKPRAAVAATARRADLRNMGLSCVIPGPRPGGSLIAYPPISRCSFGKVQARSAQIRFKSLICNDKQIFRSAGLSPFRPIEASFTVMRTSGGSVG